MVKSIPDHYVETAAAAVQNVAYQIIRHLHEAGLDILTIAWYPWHKIMGVNMNRSDSIGHDWPEYFYSKGKAVDGAGWDVVAS
jgi:hypothetical protein